MSLAGRRATTVKLGITQTLGWASTYYLPAILANPMAADLGTSPTWVFAAFSFALAVSGVLGPAAGRWIDRHGGRRMLVASNVVFAAGLVCLGMADGVGTLFGAWLVIGIAMSGGLYEGAFAALVHLYGRDARGAITGVTLFGGLASTVGWPLTSWIEVEAGWRTACLVWAGLHLVVGLPLDLWLPSGPAVPAESSVDASTDPVAAAARTTPQTGDAAVTGAGTGLRHPAVVTGLLAYVFAATWIVSTAMAAHLPRLMADIGAPLSLAVTVGALVGPAQVAGRLFEFGLMQRWHPLQSARIAALGHPIGAVLLFFGGPPVALAFAILHGMGNGLMTIVKGTLPLALFGPVGYGARQGLLSLPSRIGQAAAPLAFGYALEHLGAASLWLTAGLTFSAFVALWLLPK